MTRIAIGLTLNEAVKDAHAVAEAHDRTARVVQSKTTKGRYAYGITTDSEGLDGFEVVASIMPPRTKGN